MDFWHELVALRLKREILARWLTNASLPEEVRQVQHAMLNEVDARIQELTEAGCQLT